MNTSEKYDGISIRELGKLFFEIGNKNLVPELKKHITIALEHFKSLREQDKSLSEIIVVADIKERLFAFALGDGSDLTGKDDDCVFYIAKSDRFDDCMELIDYICFGNHPEGYLNLDSEVCHWVSDAMPKIDEFPITIYYNSFYGEAEVDPVYES